MRIPFQFPKLKKRTIIWISIFALFKIVFFLLIGLKSFSRGADGYVEKLPLETGRVRNVVMSPDGYIYVSVETPGKILKLVPVE